MSRKSLIECNRCRAEVERRPLEGEPAQWLRFADIDLCPACAPGFLKLHEEHQDRQRAYLAGTPPSDEAPRG